MHTFFVLDEYTDAMDVKDVRALCDASVDAIAHPEAPRPPGEHVIGEVTRQCVASKFVLVCTYSTRIHRFWQRARLTIPRVVQERFIRSWRSYVDSVVLQAERRGLSYICTIDEYFAARRDNIGTMPSFAFTEVCLELDIPHEVMNQPIIAALEQDVTDMIIIGNVSLPQIPVVPPSEISSYYRRISVLTRGRCYTNVPITTSSPS